MEFWADWFDYWGCSQNSLDNFLFRRHLEMTINRGASANFYMFLVTAFETFAMDQPLLMEMLKTKNGCDQPYRYLLYSIDVGSISVGDLNNELKLLNLQR